MLGITSKMIRTLIMVVYLRFLFQLTAFFPRILQLLGAFSSDYYIFSDYYASPDHRKKRYIIRRQATLLIAERLQYRADRRQSTLKEPGTSDQ